MASKHLIFRGAATCLLLPLAPALAAPQATTTIVDTGQSIHYDDQGQISPPAPGQAFYGQDAAYQGTQPSYLDNGDGTISDLNTGLMWQKSPDFATKRRWSVAGVYADALILAGHDDWRLPTVKELYSLIDFQGSSKSNPPRPYIDTNYFDFQYPDTSTGDRLIDVQFWSSTQYVGTTMNGNLTAFGVNFADGRIKGYPSSMMPNGTYFERYVRCVRGPQNYGVNDFVDNGDNTITDLATGLMWSKSDSASTMNWEAALAHAETSSLAGHSDWRLPNAKELQCLVDYTRAPDATNQAQRGPAIDPVFDVVDDEGWCWTGTTLLETPPGAGFSHAIYICFGQGTGWMEQPPNSGNYNLLNVHGAGCQRSDPKSGDPADYPHGHGPQGDVIRIFNYVRLVRSAPTCEGVTSYCVAAPNSVSNGAQAGATGSMVVADNTLQLFCSACPPNQYGIFFYGPNQVQAAFGDGYRCVGGSLYRFGVQQVSIWGDVINSVDLTNPPAPSGQVTAGSTWNYQFWYRDPPGGGGGPAGFNLSNGVSITFCP